MLGYIAVHQPTERSRLVRQIPPETLCIPIPPPLIRQWCHSHPILHLNHGICCVTHESSLAYESHAQWSAMRRQFVKPLTHKSCTRPTHLPSASWPFSNIYLWVTICTSPTRPIYQVFEEGMSKNNKWLRCYTDRQTQLQRSNTVL
jgi:hypothetical protein